ncbi:MAG: RDD family protein [Microthrixaceae bacterium]
MSAGVVTPEAVVLELPTAGVATRAFARLIDLFLQFVVAGILGLVVAQLVAAGMSPELGFLLILVLVLLVLPVAVESLSGGRSLGKLVFGLRVVGRDGSPATARQAAVRGLVALIDIYATLGFLALVTAMSTQQAQRPGDLAAGTVVLRERNRTLVETPIAFLAPPGYEAYVASLDVGRLDDEDFSLIRSFLLRVAELSPEARRERAMALATAVRARIDHDLPGAMDPELWLVCVASAHQLRQGNLLADAALGLAPIAAPSWTSR